MVWKSLHFEQKCKKISNFGQKPFLWTKKPEIKGKKKLSTKHGNWESKTPKKTKTSFAMIYSRNFFTHQERKLRLHFSGWKPPKLIWKFETQNLVEYISWKREKKLNNRLFGKKRLTCPTWALFAIKCWDTCIFLQKWLFCLAHKPKDVSKH